jgi:NDP-sugar pyrophosphorylase family protein
VTEPPVLGGGRGERLGDAARGRPKPLVPVAGRPLAAYTVARLAAAGVDHVVVACAAGAEAEYEAALAGLGVDVETVGEPEPLGRGGGLRLAASRRREGGPVLALNGDELLDLDVAALLRRHEESGAAATITVAQPPSQFGVVDLDPDDLVTGFSEAGRVPFWVSCGVYVLGEEALEQLPERGDHETTTFPRLATERRLAAFRHEGLWLTVNTPKELRRAEAHVAEHPEWLAA